MKYVVSQLNAERTVGLVENVKESL